MSTLHSIELYDPESPSLDDDLCLEFDRSSTYKVDASAVSCVRSCESSVNISADIEDAENPDSDELFSATEGSTHLASSQYTTTVHEKWQCLSDIGTDEHVKPVLASKPAVIWRSTKKMLSSALKEFDDVQTVNDDTVKMSENVTAPEIQMRLPDLDCPVESQSFEQLQQQCSNSDPSANDKVTPTVCDGLDTLQRTQTSESGSKSPLQNSHVNSMDEIAELTEPCDGEQVIALSQQPRTIKLCRIEDPSEPDDLLQISDPDFSTEQTNCPRIIRLERDNYIKPCPVAQQYDISDPSEPTDVEPIDDDSHRVLPREIKLNRVDDSRNLFDSFAFPSEQDSSSLFKPHVIELNTLLAKTKFDDSIASPVADTVSDVHSSDVETADYVPLSPTFSIESVSDNECNVRQEKSELSNPTVIPFDNSSCNGVIDVENKCSLSNGSVNSDHSVSVHQYLSDGEIVDEEEEEEFGIFQINEPAASNRKEKQDNAQQKTKCGKKRLHDDIVDDLGLQPYGMSEDEPDHSTVNKRQKLSKDASSFKSSSGHCIEEHNGKSVNQPTEVQQFMHGMSKAPSKLSSLTKQKHKKHKGEWASTSPEKLLVGYSHPTKRKVVVVNRTADESKKERHSEHCFSPPLRVTHKILPRFSPGPLFETPLNSDVPEIRKRTPNKRRHTAKRHHKRHKHQSELHARKYKRKHKKRKQRKHRSDVEGSVVDFVQRRSRSRARSYDRIVEMIRSEEQQSPRVRHMRSVVVHKNTLISARHRSSSGSSLDSSQSFDSLSPVDVCQNSDGRSRNISGDHMHLSRLSYTGELEHDGRATLLGECIKSKYGPDYDINFIFRNLADICSSADDAKDDVEILGISYPPLHNSNLQRANISNDLNNDKRGEIPVSSVGLGRETRVVLVEGRSSIAGVTNPPNNDIGSDKVERKKVMMSSKEVQTQVSLFAETHDRMTKSNMLSESSKNQPSKADKELQVSDFDNEEECIHSPSSTPADNGNTISSEHVCGIQSPESHVEESSHVPRPVLLERTDAPKHTPDSPKQDLSDLYVTVPNASKFVLSTAKPIALERVTEKNDVLPPVAMSDTKIAYENATEQLQVGLVSVSSTDTSRMSYSVVSTEKSDASATEQLSSFKISHSDVVEQLPVCSIAHNEEQFDHVIPITAPAVHQLPPVIQHKPTQYQRAVPLRRANLPLTVQSTLTLNGHSNTVISSDAFAIQQLQSKPHMAMSDSAQLQQPLASLSLSHNVSDTWSAPAVIDNVSSSACPQMQQDYQTKKCSPQLAADSVTFFSVKSDRIPGICEDVEPDDSHYQSRIDSLSRHNSVLHSSFPQLSGSLDDVINAMITTTTTLSEIQQQTVTSSSADTSYVRTGSYMASDTLPLSSCQADGSTEYSVSERSVMPTVTASSGISAMKQSVAPVLLPLLGTIATHLFKTPQQPTTAVPFSSTAAAGVATDSNIPAVSSESSVVTEPTLKCVTTTVTSTEAISAWITSLPKTTVVNKPQPRIQSKPIVELDFDVDAVESPKSDEIMSFSPPSSEHMMAVVKMKHTIGLKKKSSRNKANDVKEADKTEKPVSHIILMAISSISLFSLVVNFLWS